MSEPTGKYSITMPRDIAEAARERSGPSGFSAYVSAAVARQLERDKLDELIAAGEAENGPVDPAAVEEKRAVFTRARAGQNAQPRQDRRIA
ncbi:CopG family transcriptional regulator [Spirillospora sp. NPDC029432]|uniref:CopG family transcriptional regulator n=1 Tax=Spirillospora sp. NPDC029432 TaxID=3154599 RepID=UPI003456759D